MAKKFIPDGETALDVMAAQFACAIAKDPARFKLSGEDAALITAAVDDFRRLRAAANSPSQRNELLLMERDAAKLKAKEVIRKYANPIRADQSIDPIDKMRLGMKLRPAKLKARKCPQTKPLLAFKGAIDAHAMRAPVHVLTFREEPHVNPMTLDMAPLMYRAKPPGATRVELYVELVDEGEPMPTHPGELSGGRPWYLQSFSRSPMKVAVPVCARPLMVVYWACWANDKGERGPFSRTCVARVEGWSSLRAALPDPAETRRRQQRIVITTARRELPEPQHQQIEMSEVKLLEDAA